LGYLGVPVLAAGKAGLVLGPTFGYLVGMALAVCVVGGLSESGFAKGFWRSLLSAYVGSILIFAFGLLGLCYFVEGEALLVAGLYPFLIGDLIKNVAAASIFSSLEKKSEKLI
jgi:biotin transporter BioY